MLLRNTHAQSLVRKQSHPITSKPAMAPKRINLTKGVEEKLKDLLLVLVEEPVVASDDEDSEPNVMVAKAKTPESDDDESDAESESESMEVPGVGGGDGAPSARSAPESKVDEAKPAKGRQVPESDDDESDDDESDAESESESMEVPGVGSPVVLH